MAKPLLKWGLPILTGTGSLVGWRVYAEKGQGAYAPPFPDNYLTGFGHSNSPSVNFADSVVKKVEPATQDLTQKNYFEQERSVHPTFGTDLEKVRKEADDVLNKINDYTFRLFSPCGVGTGWILDYQLADAGKYPTTWYIATNAHVIKQYRFSKNPYEQELHIPDKDTRWLRSRYARNPIKFDHISLWSASCDWSNWYGWFDLSLSHSSNGQKLGLDKGMVHNNQIEEPNLFFLATNFLEKNQELGVNEEHYRDFAVLEIKFKDEKFAKEVTRGFADKYRVESTNAINVFADSLETKYSWNKLETLEDNFYNLGYPAKFKDNWEKFAHHINFERNSARAGRLSSWYTQTNETDKVRGFIKATEVVSTEGAGVVDWAGKTKTKVGNLIIVDEHKDHNLSGGSSGSMYTDKDGNLIGVKALRDEHYHSFITPLRSKEVKNEKGKLLSPAYDLIVGGKQGQTSSYKQQLEKYILKNGTKTWLSAREWKHLTK